MAVPAYLPTNGVPNGRPDGGGLGRVSFLFSSFLPSPFGRGLAVTRVVGAGAAVVVVVGASTASAATRRGRGMVTIGCVTGDATSVGRSACAVKPTLTEPAAATRAKNVRARAI